MSTVITVENLGKRYVISHQRRTRQATLRDALTCMARRARDRVLHPLSPSGTSLDSEEVWALRDVSFEIQQGERVGIIGRNGAGKSTLLKILSRITHPTTGRVHLRGRVSSLLEVGTGFHPELTGRENIFLNGAILGMTRQEIKSKFDEIVAFAEIERFLDTPVKHYSSGMYVRLAFAVAAHLEPEILIVDEVLAVGDAQFQKKCLGKMEDVAKQGRTVLFVSHNMQAVTSLCSRAMLVSGGRLEKDGGAVDVVSTYVSSVLGDSSRKQEQLWTDRNTAPGNNMIRLRRISVTPAHDVSGNVIAVSTPLRVEVEFWNLMPQTPLVINLFFFTIEGAPVFETISTADPNWRERTVSPGLFASACSIPGHLFNEGTFRVKVRFFNYSSILYDNDDAAEFTVHDMAERELPWYGKYIGPIRPKLSWNTTPVLTEC